MSDSAIQAFAAAGSLALAVVVVLGAFLRRSIKNSIDNLAAVLDERLATKEAVASLETRVAVLEDRGKQSGS